MFFGARSLVDPTLLVRVVNEAGFLTKFGADGFVGCGAVQRLLFGATEPASKAPAFLGFGCFLLFSPFSCVTVSKSCVILVMSFCQLTILFSGLAEQFLVLFILL